MGRKIRFYVCVRTRRREKERGLLRKVINEREEDKERRKEDTRQEGRKEKREGRNRKGDEERMGRASEEWR